MKKVLIITYYYKHKNAMASVRSIKLAKYFQKNGCDVSVITSNQKDTWTKNYLEPTPDKNIKEIYAPQVWCWEMIQKYLEHRGRVGRVKTKKIQAEDVKKATLKTNKNTDIKSKIISYLKWKFYFTIAKQEDICMFKGLKKEYIKMGRPKYDTVIATYPTYGAFLMGMWMKKNGYCKELIADFRDPLYNPGFRNRKKESEFDKKCLENITNVADKIVCVSNGIASGIKNEVNNLRKPIHVITNGYDLDDINKSKDVNNDIKTKKHFVYTGTLYHGKRCVDMLAEVLRELIEEKKISENDFVFDYAGPDFQELIEQLSKYGLEQNTINHGFVSREESIELQNQSDALVLLTWNEKNYQGVVPGKLFEYMAIGTAPILALVTGDVINSEINEIITKTNAGVTCEAADPDHLIKLKEYVVRLFEKEFSFQSETEEYNYVNISKRYMKLL